MQVNLALVDLQINCLFFIRLPAYDFVQGTAVLTGMIELFSDSLKLVVSEI